MDAPAGYLLEKRLYVHHRSQIHAATRTRDGGNVFVRTFEGSQGRAAARSELEILRRIAHPGLLHPLELHDLLDPPVLIAEAREGILLRSLLETRTLGWSEFLSVAIDLVASVEALHAERIVHMDLSPLTVLVNPQTWSTTLLDLSLAAPVGQARSRVERMEGTLAYISPEQTGRMDRGLDLRSDLYTLGATFYHMLAGEPPFRSNDPLELVHAHLARRPRPLADVRPDVPLPLARLVAKLLEKEPDDRYQSARALGFDLRGCREALEQRGAIPPDLALGSADAPARPLFRRRLYGRDRDVHRVQDMYARVARGDPAELLLISGAPGIGKSSLLEVLRGQISERRGYLAAGKYDLYRRGAPYSGILLALQSLSQQLLTEPSQRLARWQSSLREGLGNVAAALVEVVPDLGHVLGELAPAPRVGPEETRQRLALAVARFIGSVARPEHPLVLFLDDLQWADLGSLYLVEQILLERNVGALLLVGTYRANELGNVLALSALLGRLRECNVSVHEVMLGPLPPSACAEMLADALGRPLDEVTWLAERVQLKTANVPFLIQQFVYRMCERNVIRFEPGSGWVWDRDGLVAADISDDAVGLMTEKLASLSDEPRELIKLASCVGSVFDASQLASLGGQRGSSIHGALGALADEGLIAPCAEGFRFVHDRVREAAHALCSDAERQSLHSRIGWALYRARPTQDGEHAMAICDHLNEARPLMTQEERWPLLRLNALAGACALRAGAAQDARLYFDAAASLFEESDWSRDPALAWELFYGRAESVRLSGDFSLALRLMHELERRPLTPLQASFVVFRRIGVYALIDPDRAVEVALDGLVRQGVRFPRDPSWLRLRWTQWLTDLRLRRQVNGGKIFQRATDLPEGWLAAFVQLSASAGALIRQRTRLTLLLVAWIVRKYASHGYYRAPDFALGGYAHLRLLVAPDWETSRHYGEIALQLHQSAPDPITWPKAAVQIYGVLQPWFVARRAVVDPLRRTFEEALEMGDTEYAYYAAFLSTGCQALCGVPLGEVLRQLADIVELAQRWSNATAARAAALHAGYRLLLEPSTRPLFEQMRPLLEPMAEHDRAAVAPHMLLGLCVCGEFEAAFAEAQRFEKLIEDCTGSSPSTADFQLLRGVAAAELATWCQGGARRRLRAALRASFAKVRRYAQRGPDYAHYRDLLAAERARLAGRSIRALALYEQAARRAEQHQHFHHGGLTRERRARLLAQLRQQSAAALELRCARAAYERWGCARKLAQLDASTAG